MSGSRIFVAGTGKTMVDSSLFIEAMRHVAQSVTVVTTQGEDGPTGATVSAFSSLSADPPSVLVCLRSDSRIGLAVGRNQVFCVNVLPEGASALAGHFAGRFDAEEPNRFGAIDCRHSQRASSKRRHRLRMHRRSNHFPWKP